MAEVVQELPNLNGRPSAHVVNVHLDIIPARPSLFRLQVFVIIPMYPHAADSL